MKITMTRGQFLGAAATGAVSGLISGATYVQSQRGGCSNEKLAEKERKMKELRVPIDAELKLNLTVNEHVVEQFLDRARKEYHGAAIAGDGSSQYYLGKCYQYAAKCCRSNSQLYSQLIAEAETWFAKGEANLHPACMYLSVKGGIWDDDNGYRNKMKECILLGSVDAVHAMNGIDDAVFPGSSTEWASHGPYAIWPNRGGYYDTCEEAIRYWMVFIFFSLRWDPSQKFFSVGVPISDLWLGMLLPVSDDSPNPPAIPDAAQLVRSMNWSYERACRISLGYLPSEVWTALW